MEHTYTTLFERICEHCRREEWYGGALDRRTSLQLRPDHPQGVHFAYPPASEILLQATEAALGFPLPPLLRLLYAEVANGGFGPEAGISGALGGYGSRLDEPAKTIVDDYRFHCQVGYANGEHHEPVRLVDLADYTEHWRPSSSGTGVLLLPSAVWPEQLLSLEDLGCCMRACLDCKTGRVLCVAPSGNDEEYEIGPIASSLEEYLERWLREEVVP